MEVNRRTSIRRDEDALLIQRWRRIFTSVAIGYLIVVCSSAVALYLLERRDRIRLHDAAMASCLRVNVLRGQDNENALVIYGALYSSSLRERKLAQVGGPGAATHRKAVHTIAVYANALRHTPLTDCDKAVDEARSYKPAQPRRFAPSDLRGTGLLPHS